MIVFLIMFIVFGGISYWLIFDSMTFGNDFYTEVKGYEFTEWAENFFKENPSVTEEEAWWGTACDVESLWTSKSILMNKLFLVFLFCIYLLIIILWILKIYFKKGCE